MQLHELQPNSAHKRRKRVGRGGKRGTYSGKGMKGQKSRAGRGMQPGFRGGDTRLFKLVPKQRGSSKVLGIRRKGFMLRRDKLHIVKLSALDKVFEDGEMVTLELLKEKRCVDSTKHGVKILRGSEVLRKKLAFQGVQISKGARDEILKAGGKIIMNHES